MPQSEWMYLEKGNHAYGHIADITLRCSGGLSAQMKDEIKKGDYDFLSFGSGEWHDLKFIRDLPIRFLDIGQTSKFDMDSVLHLPAINGLRISDASSIFGFDFSHLTSLENLDVGACANLSFPSSIRTLHLNSYQSSMDNVYSQIDDLIYLRLAYFRRELNSQGLEKFINMEVLELANLPKLDSIKFLNNMSALKDLSLAACKRISDMHVISDLRNLILLHLSQTSPMDSLSFLRKFKQLEYFVLGGTNVLDNDLKPILELLNLRYCEVTNKRTYNVSNKDVREHLRAKFGRILGMHEIGDTAPWINCHPWRMESVMRSYNESTSEI